MPGLAFSNPSMTGCIVGWVSQEKKLTVDSAAPELADVVEPAELLHALRARVAAARALRAITVRRLIGARRGVSVSYWFSDIAGLLVGLGRGRADVVLVTDGAAVRAPHRP